MMDIVNVKLSYELSNKTFVTLKLYDLLGREVLTIVNSEQEPGNYSRIVDANELSSGVYFYRLQAGSFMETKKLLLTINSKRLLITRASETPAWHNLEAGYC